jgi:phage-related protein
MIRSIAFYGNYFQDFYEEQDQKIRDKIDYVLDLIVNVESVPKKFFKSLSGTDGLYEIRVITTRKNIRIMCFLDEGNLIVLVNCFVKKAQKTPRKEIKLAERLKKEYYNE